MCGIAGYVGARPVEDDAVRRTLELMRHRGPDDQAHVRFSTPDGRFVEFLHARLNIIDLDPRSNQPFRVGDQWMIYNGELYNYLELREALARRGTTFATTSDTEVLLETLAHGGWQTMDRCEGMWAFALYDAGTGEVGLCRDRFGEKPLYLYRDDGGLYFGSEVKFIASLLQRRLAVNHRHLHRYLVNGYKALYKTDETFFAGVEELPAGTTLRVGSGGAERRDAYWSPPRPQEDSISYEEAVAATRERLIRSVELRLRADVPLAFCMSGGIDSLSLISVARRELDYDVHGFTIVNEDERYEEQEMVDHAVDQLRVRHTSIPVETADFLPRLRGLVRQHDAPVYTITYYAHWLLMQSIAAHGYRISVSGTAADELFSGYYDHHLAYLRDVHGQPALFERSLESWREHVEPTVRNPFLKNHAYFVEDPTRRDHVYLGAEEFASHLRVPFAEPFTERTYTNGALLRNRMLNELFAESVPVILHEDDHNAMSFSIENRSPFLDRDLFEYSLRIPTGHLVQRGMAKAVLRDSMRGIVPQKILDNRRKVGFNAPIHSFLDVHDPGVREELLCESPVFEHVKRERIEAMLERDWLPNSESKFLFNFLNMKLFLEEFEG
jgi:asparagine synthase (glutamine-hydrolysing)